MALFLCLRLVLYYIYPSFPTGKTFHQSPINGTITGCNILIYLLQLFSKTVFVTAEVELGTFQVEDSFEIEKNKLLYIVICKALNVKIIALKTEYTWFANAARYVFISFNGISRPMYFGIVSYRLLYVSIFNRWLLHALTLLRSKGL